MNTKVLSQKTLDLIEQYKNFKIGNAVCSIPYYNNKSFGGRAKLKVEIGKGSPKEIYDEVIARALLEKVDAKNLMSTDLKKFLVDHAIGIDCSGFAYYILNEESESRGKGNIDRHISFPMASGILGKLRCKLRPIENTDVATLAHDENSELITLPKIEVADMITMIGKDSQVNKDDRDHILIVSQIDYQNYVPVTIHYIHSIAWPSDGIYESGVREGKIEILDPNKSLLEQKWTEAGKTGNENYTFSGATKSSTQIRRLKHLK